jgi:uncharacterized protein (TIGR02996 family)
MNQEEAFLAALAENPEDETTRLVFADWLEEHDEPDRAEFIRVQCALARLAANDPTRTELTRRETELFRQGAGNWLDRAALDLLFGVEFDPAEQEVVVGPLWEGEMDAFAFERGWLHSLCFVWMAGPADSWRRWLRAGFASPAFRLLHTFESWYVDEDEDWDPPSSLVEDPLEGVLDGRTLPSLRVLKVGGPEPGDYMTGVPRQTATALPGLLEGLPGLTELHLNAHGADYPAVFAPERLPALRRLRLTTQSASDPACIALADSGLLAHLRTLELAGASEEQLTEDGLGALLQAMPARLRRRESSAEEGSEVVWSDTEDGPHAPL